MSKTTGYTRHSKGFTCGSSLEIANPWLFEAISIQRALSIFISCLILLNILTTSCSTYAPDVQGEALIELLKALNDSNQKLDWNYYLVTPCISWSRVICRGGNVVSLSLDSLGFSGTLSPAITKLTFLATLELQNNSLSGPLPDYLGNMVHLQSLNFSNNDFHGSIPHTWGQLSNLKQLDLSANNLTGEIPKQFFALPMFNFTGTNLSCGTTFKAPCVSSSPLPVSTSKPRVTIVAVSASCSALILLVGAVFACRYCQQKQLGKDIFVDVPGEDDREISLGQLKRFSWREIQLATNNFSESNIIGQGGFGKVYRGVLSDNTKVAVKCLADHHSPGGEAAFQREIQLISAAVHKNLLRLIGFCTTSSQRILVYPYMQNRSVAYRLRDLKPGEKGLDWPTRKRIAFGTAQGLEYLHEQCDPKIIHRDLKAANILLDENFDAVLGDFGLAKLVDTKLTHVTTQIRGTMGHIPPEYLTTGKSSEKTDVFGYGITLLELVTGQRAIDLSRLEEEEDVLLLDHIKKVLRENKLDKIVDANLKTYDLKEIETMVQIALLCTQSLPEDRPTMSQVVDMLQGSVGIAERWAAWEQQENERKQESLHMPHQYVWIEDSSVDQEAIQLSQAR